MRRFPRAAPGSGPRARADSRARRARSARGGRTAGRERASREREPKPASMSWRRRQRDDRVHCVRLSQLDRHGSYRNRSGNWSTMPVESVSAMPARDGECGRTRRRRPPTLPWSRATTSWVVSRRCSFSIARRSSRFQCAGWRLLRKRCDLVGVRAPAGLLGGELRLVAGLGRGDQVGGDQDVLSQQLRVSALPAAAP